MFIFALGVFNSALGKFSFSAGMFSLTLAAILLCLGRIIFELDARRCVLAPLIFNAGGLRFAMGAFSLLTAGV